MRKPTKGTNWAVWDWIPPFRLRDVGMGEPSTRLRPTTRWARRCAVLVLALMLAAPAIAAPAGRVVCQVIDAPALADNAYGIPARQRVVVYLPPTYTHSDERFPVIYFLPNFGCALWRYTGGSFQGFRLKEAMDRLTESGAIRETIVVLPNAQHATGHGFYRNSPLSGGWEDYVVSDVIEWTDARFRTIRQPSARGLAGHGVGGFGALELAWKHPDVFGAAYALSPALIDERGLDDLGIFSERQVRRWLAKSEAWKSLAEPVRRRAFRDYLHARVTSPVRERQFEGFFVAYGTAVAPDLRLPFPHIAYPFAKVGQPPDSQILGAYETGFGGWERKLADFRSRGLPLRSLTIEYGETEELDWIPRGSRHVSRLLTRAGVPHRLIASPGNHESHLGQRLTAMLTDLSRALEQAKAR